MIGFGKLYPRAKAVVGRSNWLNGDWQDDKPEIPTQTHVSCDQIRNGLISPLPTVSEVAYCLWENGYSDNPDENWYEAERRMAWFMNLYYGNTLR